MALSDLGESERCENLYKNVLKVGVRVVKTCTKIYWKKAYLMI